MQLIKVSAGDYAGIFHSTPHIFNSPEFCELNSDKFGALHYIVFRDNGVKGGIVLGQKQGCLYSPVSAPFGGFSFLNTDISLQSLERMIALLEEYGQSDGYDIEIALPPMIYNQNVLSKCMQAFSRSGFSMKFMDINFQMECGIIGDDYEMMIPHTGRKNLSKGIRNNFIFTRCEDKDEYARAYEVIRCNRESKGYPLRMDFGQVMDTVDVVTADFFLLRNEADVDVCAALVFNVAPEIVQVIYWGDKPGYSDQRPMNVLAAEIYGYYRRKGVRIIDIGPSSEEGIPGHGLCQFKTSIGCTTSIKPRYRYEKRD